MSMINGLWKNSNYTADDTALSIENLEKAKIMIEAVSPKTSIGAYDAVQFLISPYLEGWTIKKPKSRVEIIYADD